MNKLYEVHVKNQYTLKIYFQPDKRFIVKVENETTKGIEESWLIYDGGYYNNISKAREAVDRYLNARIKMIII